VFLKILLANFPE